MNLNNNMIDFDSKVIDERLVRLNEIVNTKNSDIPKGKQREEFREIKNMAKYVIKMWDSRYELERIVRNDDEEFTLEVRNIIKDRLKQLNNEKQ